jgi:glutamate--cysteine ligase
LSDVLQQRLALLSRAETLPLLRQLRHGIEKESLRIDAQGHLAQTDHPRELGSTLTHPLITTDYSEALLEFITLVSADVGQTLEQLDAIHRFAYANLGAENLWTASMPCVLGDDADIPVARYGSSNIAQMKTIYRVGLGYRYGRRMQTIAGIHYNFSLPETLWPALCGTQLAGPELQQHITDAYFSLIRNFRRYSWLLIYLFGASPALCRTFLDGRSHQLQELGEGTLYQPFGTSLRMGDLGYQSSAQENLKICYNRLDSYVDTLKQAILNPHPDYQRIGVQVDGEYRQLSAGLLQIENEFYSPIRPKRVARQGETALTALANRGVEYVEVRCIDVNPYLPLGIDAELIRFLDAFLLFCLLDDSPHGDADGIAELKGNMKKVVNEGRRPQLQLQRGGKAIGLQAWAGELLDSIADTAALLDRAHGGSTYADSLAQQRRKVADAQLTPSAQVLRELRGERTSFAQFALQRSLAHGAYFRGRQLSPQLTAEFTDMAERSLRAQAEIEGADRLPFDTYLERYFQQYQAL